MLNVHVLRKAGEVRGQLQRNMARLGFTALESCSGDMDHLRKALVAVSPVFQRSLR